MVNNLGHRTIITTVSLILTGWHTLKGSVQDEAKDPPLTEQYLLVLQIINAIVIVIRMVTQCSWP